MRAVSSSRTIGVYALREGRKRLILADENGLIPRPSGGWRNIKFFPLVPPRSSRPGTASSYRENLKSSYSPRSSMNSTPSAGGALLRGTYDENKAAEEFKRRSNVYRKILG